VTETWRLLVLDVIQRSADGPVRLKSASAVNGSSNDGVPETSPEERKITGGAEARKARDSSTGRGTERVASAGAT